MDKKVTVIGAGNVGATAAQRLAEKELCDVVLVDIIEGVPQGKALDLTQAAPIEKHDAHLVGANAYDATAGSDIVIITAGIPRKPGMSRDDLLTTNAGIVKKVTQEVAGRSPRAVLIIVSNPLDAMCHVAFDASKFPTRISAEVKNWSVEKVGEDPEVWKYRGRHSQFAAAAAESVTMRSAGVVSSMLRRASPEASQSIQWRLRSRRRRQ